MNTATETRELMPVKGHYEMRDGSADWVVITKAEYVAAEVAAGCWDDTRPGEPVHWSFTSGHQSFRFVPDPTPADDDELREQTR